MNQKINIRFYEELNDFLPKKKCKTVYDIDYFGRQSVKDLIESQGVPHTEIDLIVVNGISVDFNYIIEPGDFISVYPIFELLDISPVIRLRHEALREPKFILDVHLGKLAKYMRTFGFDSMYRNDLNDKEIVQVSTNELRTILTRDKGILMYAKVQRGYLIRHTNPLEQIKEVIQKFDLTTKIKPFTRCMPCNGILEPVEKEEIFGKLEPKTKIYYDEFYICQSCGKIYWKGSHWEKMQVIINRLINN